MHINKSKYERGIGEMIRKNIVFLLVGVLLAIAGCASVKLAEEGKTAYIIVLPDTPTKTDKFAAKELVQFLKESTAADFKIGNAGEGKKRIFIGTGSATVSVLGQNPTANFSNEEHAVKTVGDDIFLYGKGQLGNLYAVYDFLENEIGWRAFLPYETPMVPKHAELSVGNIDRRTKLSLPVRAISTGHFKSSNKGEGYLFLLRNKMNRDIFENTPFSMKAAGIDAGDEELPMVGPEYHSLFCYIPPNKKYPRAPEFLQDKEYFATNPEFFSMDEKGQRCAKLQLCFSNPAMRKELTQNVEETLKRAAGKGIVAIQSNDNVGKFCYCPECKKLEQKYKSNGGPMFDYLLEFAAILKKDYPDARATTLIYRRDQTQVPPENIIFPDNIIAIFAPVEDNFATDWNNNTAYGNYGRELRNTETYEHLKKWCQISSVWVWYYPNTYDGSWGVMGTIDRIITDVRLMIEAGVKGAYFEHDVYVRQNFGFTGLQTYLMLKLFQNPDQSTDKLIDEYMRYAYGSAAPIMRAYMDELEKVTKNKNLFIPCGSHVGETSRYASAENALKWQQMFDEAEKLVLGNPLQSNNIGLTRVYLDTTSLYNWGAYSEKYPDYFKDGKILADRIRKVATGRVGVDFWPIVDSLLMKAQKPKPLPVEFNKYPSENIVQEIPHFGVLMNRNKVNDPDAAYGVATETQFENPFQFGFYDFADKVHGPKKTLEVKDILPDKYKFYHLGVAKLSKNCKVWLSSNSWCVGYEAQYLCGEPGAANEWDIWVSLKFEGPAYPGSKAVKDRILSDRVVLVKVK